MKMHLSKFFCIFAVLLLLACSGCSQDGREKKYIRLGVSEDAAGLSLLLTGKLAGTQKLSHYVYFDTRSEEGYAERIIDYMDDSSGLNAAYFEESDVPALLSYNERSEDPLLVIYVDSFNEDGSIHGFFAAKESWCLRRTKDFSRFMNGLVKTASYRYDHSVMEETSFAGTSRKTFDSQLYRSVYDRVAELKLSGDVLFQESRYSRENNIEIMTTPEQFTAVYEIDNLTYDALGKTIKTDAGTLKKQNSFENVSFCFLSPASAMDLFGSTTDSGTLRFDSSSDGGELLLDLLGEEGLRYVSLDLMVQEMKSVREAAPAAEKKNSSPAILIVTGISVLLIILFLVLILRKRSSESRISIGSILRGE